MSAGLKTARLFRIPVTLFRRNPDGAPVEFYVEKEDQNEDLKAVIEKGGGLLVESKTKAAILLCQDKNDNRIDEGFLPFDYVTTCVKKSTLVDPDVYRQTNNLGGLSKDVSQDNIEVHDSDDGDDLITPYVVTTNQLKGRQKYSDADDINIIRYLVNHGRYKDIGGLVVWKDMASVKITQHSYQSMKDRFRKQILPNLDTYNIPEQWKAKLRGQGNVFTNKGCPDEETISHHFAKFSPLRFEEADELERLRKKRKIQQEEEVDSPSNNGKPENVIELENSEDESILAAHQTSTGNGARFVEDELDEEVLVGASKQACSTPATHDAADSKTNRHDDKEAESVTKNCRAVQSRPLSNQTRQSPRRKKQPGGREGAKAKGHVDTSFVSDSEKESDCESVLIPFVDNVKNKNVEKQQKSRKNVVRGRKSLSPSNSRAGTSKDVDTDSRQLKIRRSPRRGKFDGVQSGSTEDDDGTSSRAMRGKNQAAYDRRVQNKLEDEKEKVEAGDSKFSRRKGRSEERGNELLLSVEEVENSNSRQFNGKERKQGRYKMRGHKSQEEQEEEEDKGLRFSKRKGGRGGSYKGFQYVSDEDMSTDSRLSPRKGRMGGRHKSGALEEEEESDSRRSIRRGGLKRKSKSHEVQSHSGEEEEDSDNSRPSPRKEKLRERYKRSKDNSNYVFVHEGEEEQEGTESRLSGRKGRMGRKHKEKDSESHSSEIEEEERNSGSRAINRRRKGRGGRCKKCEAHSSSEESEEDGSEASKRRGIAREMHGDESVTEEEDLDSRLSRRRKTNYEEQNEQALEEDVDEGEDELDHMILAQAKKSIEPKSQNNIRALCKNIHILQSKYGLNFLQSAYLLRKHNCNLEDIIEYMES